MFVAVLQLDSNRLNAGWYTSGAKLNKMIHKMTHKML